MFIDNIFKLDQIFNFERHILKKKMVPVTNISHWNSSRKYQEYISKYIRLNYEKDIFNYMYTYDIPFELRQNIIKKLGCLNLKNTMCLLTSSSTQSILNIINYLKLFNYHKLCLLTPAYFSVEESCKIMRMPYEKKCLLFSDNEYIIPFEDILNNKYDVVWLTSPVYSTGMSFSSMQISKIKNLIDLGILVIADESLALPGQELVYKIPINKYFFSIFSPHKPLFINNIKFSGILCPKENDDFFEQWIDVLSGSLLQSNIIAISHYLSENYQDCLEQSIKWFKKGNDIINMVLSQFPHSYCDTTGINPYKCIYLEPQNGKNLNELDNIFQLISKQFISYIPGVYNGFEKNVQCFRVNMSFDAMELENALYRILQYYT